MWYNELLRAANNEDIFIKYRMKETLGVGKFSTVRKAYLRNDESHDVAIKIISKKSITEKEKEYILNELSVLKMINHPSVPKIHQIHETNEKLYIVMETIKDGELFDYLVESSKLSFEEATEITSKLLKLSLYLKELRVMHRDIKTENILVKLDRKNKLKKIYLIDFGLAKYIDSRDEVTQKLGTMGYCAPEVILKNAYDQKVDMWSIGIVYFLLLVGKLPFDGKTHDAISDKTVNSPLYLDNKVLNKLDEKVKTFLSKCLEKDPKDRFNIEEGLAMISAF